MQGLARAATFSTLVLDAIGACNATSVERAPAVIDDVQAALDGAKSACLEAVGQGYDLLQLLVAALDEVGTAEEVTSCHWVGASYDHVKELACGPAHGQAQLLGIFLGGAALCLWIGLCGLACLRPSPAVALEWVDRDAARRDPTRSPAAMQLSSGVRDRGESALERERGASVVVERESPFATYRRGSQVGSHEAPLPRVQAQLMPNQPGVPPEQVAGYYPPQPGGAAAASPRSPVQPTLASQQRNPSARRSLYQVHRPCVPPPPGPDCHPTARPSAFELPPGRAIYLPPPACPPACRLNARRRAARSIADCF